MHKKVYGDNTMSRAGVSKRLKRFKAGHEAVKDDSKKREAFNKQDWSQRKAGRVRGYR